MTRDVAVRPQPKVIQDPRRPLRHPPLSIRTLFYINALLLEHSIIMVEDFEVFVTFHVVLAGLVFLWLYAKRKISAGLAIVILIFVSVAWKWVLMVKRIQAKKMATLFYLEPACLAQQTGSSWFSQAVEYIWPRKAASCQAYFEAVHVESFWEVSPLDAMVETGADVLFRPLDAFGKGIAGYFGAIISGTPFFWTPVVMVLGSGLLIVVIFGLLRYEIRLPFISIGPASSSSSSKVSSRSQRAKPPPLPHPEGLPYPVGKNLLDHLVPPSIKHDAKPEYYN